MISTQTKRLIERSILWDNHACMPLRPEDETFLPQLARHKAAGVSLVILNVYFDMYPPETIFLMLAAFRRWIGRHSEHYVLAETVVDIESAKRNGKLAVVFDIEGGKAVEGHPGLVEIFYRLGVRWMLIAYNRNNRLGGGCQDEDCGLTDYGRLIIDEMERVGMVLCCSHTGYRTAREAMDYSSVMSHKKLVHTILVQELSLETPGESIWALADQSYQLHLRRRNDGIWKPSLPRAAYRTDWCGART